MKLLNRLNTIADAMLDRVVRPTRAAAQTCRRVCRVGGTSCSPTQPGRLQECCLENGQWRCFMIPEAPCCAI